MAKEEWRDVVGYEGQYEVSSLGRVRRVADGPGMEAKKPLRPGKVKGGYLQVCLHLDGQRRALYAHRLVAEAFLGVQPDGYEINHRNGSPADNRPENLEWVTHSQNMRHAYRVLGNCPINGEDHYRAKLTEAEVRRIRKLYATGQYTQTALGEKFNMAQPTISQIICRATWKHI